MGRKCGESVSPLIVDAVGLEHNERNTCCLLPKNQEYL